MDNQELAQELAESQKIEFDSKIMELVREMALVGLMYGHKKSKTNPKFKQYIYTTRGGMEIIDLAQTLSALDKAVEFLKAQIKNGKTILLIAIQPAAKEAMTKFSQEFKFPSINERWIGGLLTNFKTVSRRIEYFKKIKADSEKGTFEKYTKKERSVINKSIARMETMFSGLENLEKLPDIVFIIDNSLKGHATALREAKRLKIPVVAVIDSDDNPEAVDYPIPANDHAKSSIDWIVNQLIEKLK